MRVKMLKLMCNATYGNHGPGAVVDLPDKVAEARIAAGDCVPVDAPDGPAAPSHPAAADGEDQAATPVDQMTVDEPDGPAAPPHPAAADGEDQAATPVDQMTVDELRAYAAEHGIDLGGATRKRDILAVIEAAQDED